jgi:hypothetical protein
MEIYVLHRGEELGNNLEGTSGRILGRSTMTEYHEGLYPSRTEINKGRPKRRIYTTNKVLEAETG